MKEGNVEVNGINMYYREAGEGFPLLGIMGLGANADWWPPNAINDFSAVYRFIMPDNRGAGRTDCPAEQWTIEMNADDMMALLDVLGIEKAHVMGFSMGGTIAQSVAIQYPERVEKLLLCCTTCGFAHGVPLKAEFLESLGSFATGTFTQEEMGRKVAEFLFSPRTLETFPEIVDGFAQLYCIAPISDEGLMKQMIAGTQFDFYDQLGQIKAPTLIMTGLDDLIVPHENSDILYENIPGARLMKFSPAGHAFIGEVPEFISIVKDFLG